MPLYHQGPTISEASSVRVPSFTMGHPILLDALLTPVPTSELTLPQFPQEESSRRVRDSVRAYELHNLRLCYAFTGTYTPDYRSPCQMSIFLEENLSEP